MSDDAPPENPAQPQIIHVPTNIPFPTKLDMKGNISANWKKFKRVLENYEIASGLKTKENEIKTATFLTCIGAEALEIYDGLQFDNDIDRKNIEIVVQKFENFCIGETNETYERYKFNKRDQEQNETIDTYVAALRTLSKTCNYAALEESLIRDRIVIGIRDNNTRKKLLQDHKLTLKKCIDICRANETTTEQLKKISSEEVQYVKKKTTKPFNKLKKPSKSGQKFDNYNQYEQSCKFCGKRHKPNKDLCPAWGKTCSNCGVKNHFAAKCRKINISKSKRNVHNIDEISDSSEEDYVLTVETSEIDEIKNVTEESFPKKIFASMLINNNEIKFQLDCGSTVNVLPEYVYKELVTEANHENIEKSYQTLIMFNGTETKPLGKKRFSVRNPKNKKKYNIEFVIVKENLKPILGARAIQHMKLVSINRENIMKLNEKQSTESTDGKRGNDQNQSTVSPVGYLTKEKIVERYKDVFESEGKLDGKLHLEIDPKVKPIQLPVRKVPVAVKEKLKTELDRLTDLEIITPVQVPTEWISATVVVMKPDGRVRLCIDPKPLNKALKRNHFPTPTIDDILPELSKARLFSVCDARNGFWHVELDESSSYLTTFATPWGRYRWKRMPFGISPAPEEFQRRMSEALEGLEGVKVIQDDILLFAVGDTDEESAIDHDKKLNALLQRCREKNIKLNIDKMKLRLKEVSYLGHRISADGLKVDPNKIEAITKMPAPTDRQGVQRLLGMINYVQKFAPGLSELTSPIRELLKKENQFRWDENVHGICLSKIKNILTSTPVLKYFDPEKPTVVQCDASESGLGACIMQEGHPIAYASRSLTATECNYAQIEKELLAIVFAMERFENYVYGRHVLIESDHKPLEVICKKSLLSAPKRLQRMQLRLQKFDFSVEYKKGSKMYLADTLSRAYLEEPNRDVKRETVLGIERSEVETELESIKMVDYLAVSSERLSQLKQATESDNELCVLKGIIKTGWPETKEELPKSIRIYHTFRDELTTQDGIVFKGERIVVPHSIRNNMLSRIHNGHVGIQGCMRRAKETLYWPKMSSDIENYVRNCETCNVYQNEQQKEPLMPHDAPNRPWEKLGVDLFEYRNKNFLVTVDYYSNYFEVDRLYSTTAKDVILKLKSQFARHGIPDIIMSDNGPQFSAKDFRDFAKTYEFTHVTSSPGYPQSNGKAENAVKTAKRIMKKAARSGEDPHLSLLAWRNTPTEGMNSSPVQRLYGRRTKTLLPTSQKLLKPKLATNVKRKLTLCKDKQKAYYDRSARHQRDLNNGEIVRIRPFGNTNEWRKAVVENKVNLRSYNVKTEDGSTYRRNRRHLRISTEKGINIDNSSLESTDEHLPSNETDENIKEPPKPKVNTNEHSNVHEEPIAPRRSSRITREPSYLKDYVRK